MRFLAFFAAFWAAAFPLFSQNYSFKNVAIGGGGYALHTAIHPTSGQLFMTSDVGGMFRWDGATAGWTNLNDGFEPDSSHLYGCDGFALDPQNASTIFAAFGKYACDVGGIFKSTDAGATWTRLRSARFAGNMTKRYVGSPLAVDPNNSSRVFCGTRLEGLLKSDDAGATWQQIPTVPLGQTGDAASCWWGDEPVGCRAVVIDGNSTTGGFSSKIYAAIFGTGIFRSTDGGATFSLLSGSPADVFRIAVLPSGGLAATAATGVFKFDGSSWAAITPGGAVSPIFNALAVDPTDGQKLIVSTGAAAFSQEVFRSVNGGATWAKIALGNGQAVANFSVGWFPANHFMSATSSLTFDPAMPSRAFLTDWYSVWRADNIWASPVQWHQQNLGYEVVVNLALAAPPTGAPLLSGHGDVCGFRHVSTAAFPAAKIFGASECTSIDFQESASANLAAVVSDDWNGLNTRVIKSSNGGAAWSSLAVPSGKKNGKVAISAQNSSKMVYLPAQSPAFFTTDGGSSWAQSTGGPSAVIGTTSIFQYQNPLVADRWTDSKFYLFDTGGGRFYRSTDGGATWAQTATLPNGGSYFNFGSVSSGFNAASSGHVWVSIGDNGLWRSTNAGTTFSQVAFFENARLHALGKPVGGAAPAIFVYGKNAGEWGIFRSTDDGATWQKLNPSGPFFGDVPTAMAADRQTAGRFFVGSNGRGILEGADSAPLAVEWGEPFFAEKASKNGPFRLVWATENEVEAELFEVERAGADGFSFEKIGSKKARGTAAGRATYQFLDENWPRSEARLFYRLRQKDADGSSFLSRIVAVETGEKGASDVQFSPNPTDGAVQILSKKSWTRAVVRDAAGCEKARLELFEDQKINLAGLTAGLFFVELLDEKTGERATGRVVSR